MSLEALAAVLHHSQAQGSTKLVLTGIAWHYGDDASLGAWPSQQILANYANISVRQVRRALQALTDLEELEYRPHGGVGHRADRRTARYFILLDCPHNCDRTLQHRNTQDTGDRTTGHLRLIDRTSAA